MSRSETPVSLKVPRHHPAVGKSNRSFNSNSRSNPRTTTRRNKPPPSPRAAELRPTLTTRPPRLAARLTLLVAASSHHRYGPAAGFHAGLVPPLGHSLRAAMRPRLRAGCALLGRRLVVGRCDGRDAERRDEDSSEQQTGHHVPPQMAARPKSYIRKQAPAKFKRRARNGAACARDAESFMASNCRAGACASLLIWRCADRILAEMSH